MARDKKPWEIEAGQPVPFWIGCRMDDPGLGNPDTRLNGDSPLVFVDYLDERGLAMGHNFVTQKKFERKQSKDKAPLIRYYLISDDEGLYRKGCVEEDFKKYGLRLSWELVKQHSIDYYKALQDGTLETFLVGRDARRAAALLLADVRAEASGALYVPPEDHRQEEFDKIAANSDSIKEQMKKALGSI